MVVHAGGRFLDPSPFVAPGFDGRAHVLRPAEQVVDDNVVGVRDSAAVHQVVEPSLIACLVWRHDGAGAPLVWEFPRLKVDRPSDTRVSPHVAGLPVGRQVRGAV